MALLAHGGPARAGTDDQAGASASSDSGSAKEKFGDAVKLYKAGKPKEALPIFLEVAEATSSPNARLYMGYCLAQLGRQAEAYDAFALAIKLSQGDKYEETRQAATSELASLNARVGKIVVSLADVPEGLVVELDGARVPDKKLGSFVVLEPGVHRVEARGNGVEPVRREVSVDAGETKTVTLSFHQAPKSETAVKRVAAPQPVAHIQRGNSKLKTMGFVAGGVGAAGFVVFGVAGVMTKSTYDQLARECGTAGCSDAAHRDDIKRGKTLQTTANVGLIVGGVGAVAAGALLYLGYTSKSQESGVAVRVAPGGGTIGYEGKF